MNHPEKNAPEAADAEERMMEPVIEGLLERAKEGLGLLPEEAEFILAHAKGSDWRKVYQAASVVTAKQFKKRLNFFVPLYFSSFCANECAYCGFRAKNRDIKRKALTDEEFVSEARYLWEQGHRTLLLVAGEHYIYSSAPRIASYIAACRKNGLDFSFAVEVAPLTREGYAVLKDIGIDRCLLFQETYNRVRYHLVHRGKKRDYDWRYEGMERALDAGIQNVGLGILLGLHSWREDLAGLIRHAWQLKEKSGRFPATFSFPRLKAAPGLEGFRAHAVSDADFKKIIAVARLACPGTGIALSTRESEDYRDGLLRAGIGVTHVSAGCSTSPGGYTLDAEDGEDGQFELSDHRPLAAMLHDVRLFGYEPARSF